MPDERLTAADAPRLVQFVNANARLQKSSGSQFVIAGGISLVIHAALFAFLPSMRLGFRSFEMVEPEQLILLVAPSYGDEPSTTGGDPGVTETILLGDSDPMGSSAVGLEGLEGPVVTDAELVDLWEALGDRAARGRLRLPQLAGPPEEEQTAAAPEDGTQLDEEVDSLTIDEDAVLSELAELPEPDSLMLDRLSALAPELAFMSASAWVLIRNQAEVEAFLRRSYREGLIDESASGSVSVTLWIDRRGSVEWAEVSKSSGRTDLDELTLALFNEVAHFRAASERGLTISRSVTFSVNYPW